MITILFISIKNYINKIFINLFKILTKIDFMHANLYFLIILSIIIEFLNIHHFENKIYMKISKLSPISLPTTLGVDCTFEMPSFTSKNEITNDEKSPPIYLDSNGNVYDKNYLLIPSSPISSQSIKNNKHKKQIIPFPNPKNYKSKIEFENACIHWKEDVQIFFSGAILPKSILSFFYYPSRPSIFAPGTSEHLAFKSQRDPHITFKSIKLF